MVLHLLEVLLVLGLQAERLLLDILERRHRLEGALRGELLVAVAAVVGDVLLLVLVLLPLAGRARRILDLLNAGVGVMEGAGPEDLLPFLSSENNDENVRNSRKNVTVVELEFKCTYLGA